MKNLLLLSTILSGIATNAYADVQVRIDKTHQLMFVAIDGRDRYIWKVSTGDMNHDTPNGDYVATSQNEMWYSKKFDDAPMPHSVFFRKDGYAIHGTYEEKKLGTPASHGCVRLSLENATTFYNLVAEQGLDKTTVIVKGDIPGSYRQPEYQSQYQPPPQQYYYQERPQQYFPPQPPPRGFGFSINGRQVFIWLR